MKKAATYLVGAVVVALALFSAWQYVKGLQTKLAAAEQAARIANQGNTDRDEVIAQLRTNEEQNNLAHQYLDGQVQAIRLTLSDREREFRRLIDENKELRAWADTAVPGVIQRLHNRPAITGADAYRKDLARRNTLHAVGGSTADE